MTEDYIEKAARAYAKSDATITGMVEESWKDFEINVEAAIKASGLLEEVERLEFKFKGSQGEWKRLYDREQDYQDYCDTKDRENTKLKAQVENLENILTELLPLEIVTGDTMKRTNPHSTINLNSTATWMVTKSFRSAQRARLLLEELQETAKQALTKTKEK